MDITGYDVSTAGSGIPAEGKCHLQVVGIEDHGEYVSLVSQILAHEVESEVGKETYNNFSKKGKGAARLQRFLEATEVMTRDDFIAAKAAGITDVEPDYESAVDKTYFGALTHSTYNGKTRAKVEWEFLNPADPKSADYPRDTERAPAVKTEQSTSPAAVSKEEVCPF